LGGGYWLTPWRRWWCFHWVLWVPSSFHTLSRFAFLDSCSGDVTDGIPSIHHGCLIWGKQDVHFAVLMAIRFRITNA
jgi:hypothetical protein